MSEQEALSAGVTAEKVAHPLDDFLGGSNDVDVTEGQDEGSTEDQGEERVESKEVQTQKQESAPEQETREKNVPYAALHEERMRRKEIQQEMQDIRNRNAMLEQNFQRIQERITQQDQPKPPSFDEDPLNALRFQSQRTEVELQRLREIEVERHRQADLSNRYQAFISRYQNDAYQYMAEKAPDFKEAYQYLTRARATEMVEAGYTKEQAEELMRNDEAAIVAKAYQDGINPAERLYKLAKHRGYKQEQVQAQNPNASIEKKLDQIEKGIKASKSLNNVGGKPNNGPMTLDQIAQLSDDELDEFIGNKKQWEKLMRNH